LVNVRIVAATNKNLSEEIGKGTFREDLYYRLNVFVIHMPSLNERLDDIPLLVNLFVARASKTMGKRIDKISNKVIESFINYPWPGNVRELQNTIERMMNFVKSNELTEDLIPKEIREYHPTLTAPSNFESLADVERQMLVSMLDKTITKSQIAKKMKISRTTLYRKLEKYGLSQ
jgi:transcriptional regulator with PAS, ATPase and Fis domain